MRTPPQLEHSGTGQFTITEQTTRSTRNATYAVFTGAGEVVNGVDIVDNTINMNNVFGEYFFSYASDTALRRAVKFVRTSITYTPKSTTSCSDKCGVCCNPDAGNGSGNCFGGGACWCGSCASDGTICCGGCYGQDCSTTTTNVKDPVPAGYTERYGEWVKIDNPVQTQAVEEPVGFSLSKVEWNPDYYQARPMPLPYEATLFDEDGKPTGETIPNRPAWDYTDVYFIHYDTNGDVVWAVDHISNPECFKVVEIELMKNYEMWVSNLPPAGEGTYEFVIANDTEEFYREEGNV